MVEKNPVLQNLQIAFEIARDGEKVKARTKTFSKIKKEATNENLYEFATEIANLQTCPVIGVYINEKSKLLEG